MDLEELAKRLELIAIGTVHPRTTESSDWLRCATWVQSLLDEAFTRGYQKGAGIRQA